MALIAGRIQTITFYYQNLILCSENSVSAALKSRVHCHTTIPCAGHRIPNNKNWQWLTEEKQWVTVTPLSRCGQWCLASCSAPLLTVWRPSHRAHCTGVEETMLLQSLHIAAQTLMKKPKLKNQPCWRFCFITNASFLLNRFAVLKKYIILQNDLGSINTHNYSRKING